MGKSEYIFNQICNVAFIIALIFLSIRDDVNNIALLLSAQIIAIAIKNKK